MHVAEGAPRPAGAGLDRRGRRRASDAVGARRAVQGLASPGRRSARCLEQLLAPGRPRTPARRRHPCPGSRLPPMPTPPWWQRGAIYQIYPRSFADGDGDGVGDLLGLGAHLDHLSDLHVEALWLSPIFPSPMADFGYDVADFCDV